MSRIRPAMVCDFSAAMASSAAQNSGSSAMDVRWPAMDRERLSINGGSGLFAVGVDDDDLYAGLVLAVFGGFGCGGGFHIGVGDGLDRVGAWRRGRVELQAELYRWIEE